MSVRPEATPNPDAMKFTTNKLIFEGDDSVSVMPGDTSEHKILNDLMTLDGVANVFGYQNFITVSKHGDVEWDELTPSVIDIFNENGF